MGKRRHVNYTDSTRYRDWLDRACEDISCAEILREDENATILRLFTASSV
jgi:hypothetical protein